MKEWSMVYDLNPKDSAYGVRVAKIRVTYNFTPSYLFYSSLLKTFFPDRNPQSLWQDQEIYQEICKTSIDETISSNSMTITQENTTESLRSQRFSTRGQSHQVRHHRL